MRRFEPDNWFEINTADRKYLRNLLLDEMYKHDFGTDKSRRASRLAIVLMDSGEEMGS